jgi:hypothetical protein
MRHLHDSTQEQHEQDHIHGKESFLEGELLGERQPPQQEVKWTETTGTPLGEEVQDNKNGSDGLQANPPKYSEHGGPHTTGKIGEAFDSSDCTLEGQMDMVVETPNPSDKDFPVRPCTASPN